MKKDWMQPVTLCLCGLLLLVAIVQGKQLHDLGQTMETQVENLRNEVDRQIQGISSSIKSELEQADRLVAQYALEPNGIAKDARALQAAATVTLKQWHEDTEVLLLARIGGKELSAPMTAAGDGSYSSPLLLPLGGNGEVALDVLVTGGGLTKREALSSWGEIALLLPVQRGGTGWSAPRYTGGALSSQFNITLTGQNGGLGPIQNPEFVTYKNGQLVQTQKAVEDPKASVSNGVCYTVDAEENIWRVECALEDVIEVRFRCEDAYGLGYDFLIQTWRGETEVPSENPQLELYWPQ